MHHQLSRAALGDGPCRLQPQGVVQVAQPHLGRHGNRSRHRAPHRRHDVAHQVGLVEQYRAAAVAVHGLGRAAKVEIDALGAQLSQPRGVVGQAGRVTAQQLRPHRHASGRAAGVVQLGHHAVEHPLGQQLVGDADELGHAAVNAAHLRQHIAQAVVEQPFHGRKQDRHRVVSGRLRSVGKPWRRLTGAIDRARLRSPAGQPPDLATRHTARHEPTPIRQRDGAGTAA